MDIGTAKVSAADRARVPHHGLDLVDPDEPFSVADFAGHARAVLARLAADGGVAILAGGTGLYLRAVARGLDTDGLPSDALIRAGLEEELTTAGEYTLLRAGRYAHSPEYVIAAAERAGFRGVQSEPFDIRHEAGRPVSARIFALEKAPA